jgi:hypothetical protein
MRPSICEICHKEFDPRNEGGLIFFKETSEGREFHSRVEKEGITGHPPDAGWFCEDHYEEAEKRKHLTLGEALQKIF